MLRSTRILSIVASLAAMPMTAGADPPGEPAEECALSDEEWRASGFREVERDLGAVDGTAVKFRAATCFQGGDAYTTKRVVSWTHNGKPGATLLAHEHVGTTPADSYRPALKGKTLTVDYTCGTRLADEGQSCHEEWVWRGPDAGFELKSRTISSRYATHMLRWRAALKAGRIDEAYKAPPPSTPNGGHSNVGEEHLREFTRAVHAAASRKHAAGDRREAARLARLVVETPPPWDLLSGLEEDDFVICLAGGGPPTGPADDRYNQQCSSQVAIWVPNDPEWATILTELAGFLLDDRDGKLAAPLLAQVTHAWPQHAPGHLRMGDAFALGGATKAATAEYARFVELAGEDGTKVPERVRDWLAQHKD